MAGNVDKQPVRAQSGGGLRVAHGVAAVAVGVVGVIVAFWVLSFIAGIAWELLKVAIVVAIVAGLIRFLVRRRR